MNYTHIELIPSILKPSRPSQFDGESYTALEYVSKTAVKINECVKEFNEFIDAVQDELNTHYDEVDKMRYNIEKMYRDFIVCVDNKYKHHTKVVDDAVQYMVDNLGANIEVILTEKMNNGEFDQNILNAVNGLRNEFQTTVAVVNNYIAESEANYRAFVNEANNVIEDAHNASASAYNAVTRVDDALSAMQIAMVELDGGLPSNIDAGEEFDGGNVGGESV